MGKIVGVKILAHMSWLMVWMLEERAKELISMVETVMKAGRASGGTIQGTCALTGITWIVVLDSLHAIHTITDADTQAAQQQMAQASPQGPRSLAPSPFQTMPNIHEPRQQAPKVSGRSII